MIRGKQFNKYPLVVIEWYDHSGDAGWIELKDLEKPPILAKTVGWLIKEDDIRYHVMNTITNDGGQGGNSEILKGAVVRTKILRKSF
tara:strand:+ start:410 stop:670 length:261 start_codon:yes stop_codon:yes gene_type:complete